MSTRHPGQRHPAPAPALGAPATRLERGKPTAHDIDGALRRLKTPQRRWGVYGQRMGRIVKYMILTYAAVAYGVILGDNWHWYAMALMLYAIRSAYLTETRATAPFAERRATVRDRS